MKKILFTYLLTLVAVSGFAQKMTPMLRANFAQMINCPLDKREIKPYAMPKSAMAKAQRRAEDDTTDEEVNFIFDPIGTEKMYTMSLYCYNQSNQQFVNAVSLKSQVRYGNDGTVYFKDLTKSLGVKTWVEGTVDGDTIRIPFGQPLAYYKSQYLVFFTPMKYDDSTGNLEVLDELKLIIRGDSLCSPQFEDGVFQAVCGYVFINEENQGFLSLDLDHQLGLITRPFVEVPEDITPIQYVMKYENSSGNITQTKVNVKKQDNDIYMQLSTSAPNEYVKGTINGNDIEIQNYQPITDSTYIYFYALADAVYEGDDMTDFVTTDSIGHLSWDAATHSITAGKDVLGVDYMDDLYRCMNYTISPQLMVYGGDKIAKPKAPELFSLQINGFMDNIAFNIISEDVDGNYINTDSLYYSLYYDNELFTFTHDEYVYVSEDMTEVPYAFKDNYDFWIYGTLRYVYLYEELYSTIGLQTVYKVNGEKRHSDIICVDKDTNEVTTITVDDTDGIENLKQDDLTPALSQGEGAIYNAAGQRMSSLKKGINIVNGKKIIK